MTGHRSGAPHIEDDPGADQPTNIISESSEMRSTLETSPDAVRPPSRPHQPPPGHQTTPSTPAATAQEKMNNATTQWNGIIDGWLRDPAIRTFLFQALGLLVGGLVVAAVIASGTIAAILAALLPTVLAKSIAAGCTGSILGGGYWLQRRARRNRRA